MTPEQLDRVMPLMRAQMLAIAWSCIGFGVFGVLFAAYIIYDQWGSW